MATVAKLNHKTDGAVSASSQPYDQVPLVALADSSGNPVTAGAGAAVDTELTTKDYDSGAGTETVAVTGLIAPASGGSVAITGDAANGLDVDVTRVPAGPTTGTVTSVTGTASNTTLLAANTARLQATFFNDSTAVLYLKVGATASTTSHTIQIAGGGYYELPIISGNRCYSGIVDGIWASAAGACRVTELT